MPADFADLEPRDALDQLFHRLVRAGMIRRIIRGRYDKPSLNVLTCKSTHPDRPRSAKAKREAEPPTITDDLTGKFLRVGNKLHSTSDDKTPIVRIEPARLKTSNFDTLPDIIGIAKANGWTSIRINGGDKFKKLALLAAASQELVVDFYSPTKVVQAVVNGVRAFALSCALATDIDSD